MTSCAILDPVIQFLLARDPQLFRLCHLQPRILAFYKGLRHPGVDRTRLKDGLCLIKLSAQRMSGQRRGADHQPKAMNKLGNHAARVRLMLKIIRLVRTGSQRVRQMFVTIMRAFKQRLFVGLPALLSPVLHSVLPAGTFNACASKGVLFKPVMKAPMEPKSGSRKRVLFRLPNGKQVVAYMPSTEQNLPQRDIVFLRIGRSKKSKTSGCSQQARLGGRRSSK